MDNSEALESFEPKPGFSVADKPYYGNVITFSFNKEFAQRLQAALADANEARPFSDPLEAFHKEVDYYLNDSQADSEERDDFAVDYFQQIFTVTAVRQFALDLNNVLDGFLTQRKVSPALFTFVQKLNSCLHPPRKIGRSEY
jgi:hypothetical protein